MSPAPRSETARLLGYPDDARLLLVNADDFGMYGDVNEAIVRAFEDGIVRSTSLMTPCPGAAQAAQLAREHLAVRHGVHLSIVRDIETYRWGPLALKELVSSLLDETGNLYFKGRMAELLARAKRDELELEFRAQIEATLTACLTPTHLDWHCLLDGGRADIFDLTMGLAREYGLALRVAAQPYIDQVRRADLPANDHPALDSFSLPVEGKAARYARMLRELPVGLSEWAVHPGLGSQAAQTIEPEGWRVRQTDLAFLTSPEAREIIRAEGIILLGYEPLQAIWRQASASRIG